MNSLHAFGDCHPGSSSRPIVKIFPLAALMIAFAFTINPAYSQWPEAPREERRERVSFDRCGPFVGDGHDYLGCLNERFTKISRELGYRNNQYTHLSLSTVVYWDLEQNLQAVIQDVNTLQSLDMSCTQGYPEMRETSFRSCIDRVFR